MRVFGGQLEVYNFTEQKQNCQSKFKNKIRVLQTLRRLQKVCDKKKKTVYCFI